jgi:hypothetical protein
MARHFAMPMLAVLCAGIPGAAFAGETKGFVVEWLGHATSYVKENCPAGLNPLSDEVFKRELRRLGYPNAEVEHLMKDFPNGAYIPITTMRGRVDGQPVNVYANPWTQPDPKLLTVTGSVAYGFNLDGNEATGGFVDPETRERGVDNQSYRAIGCIQNYAVKPPNKPLLSDAQWDLTRDFAPATLIEIRDMDDPKNDDHVTVMVGKSVDVTMRGALGGTVADMSMRVDPNPRARTLVQAKLKDGMLITEKFNLRIETDPMIMPHLNLKDARLRLRIKDDGSAEGILGGFEAWWPLYWSYGRGGWVYEHASGIDMPGVYYAIKKMADADPDPKTGENRAISTAWWIDAVPAIIVRKDPQSAQTLQTK